MPRFHLTRADKQMLLSIPAVHSVAEGIVNGRRVVIVSVDPTVPLDRTRIPADLGGLPVEVVDERPLSFDATARTHAPPRRDVVRPVQPGVSVGNGLTFRTGTTSPLLTDGSELFVASNNHVLVGYQQDTTGDPVVQPGPADGGSLGERIGEVLEFAPLTNGATVDMAWAALDADVGGDPAIPGLPHPQIPAGARAPRLGEVVRLSGRSSGVLDGVIVRVNADVEVVIDEETTITLVNQAFVDAVITAGDSGAPVVALESNDVVGVAFASNDEITAMNDITEWERVSGLSVATEAADGSNGGGATDDGDGTVLAGLSRTELGLIAGVVLVVLFSGGG